MATTSIKSKNEPTEIMLADLGLNHLSGSISFNLGESQIVWAPNGTGKSSVCRALAKKCERDAALIDYEDCLQSFKKQSKDCIQIGASIKRIDEIKQRLAEINQDKVLRAALKKYGVTTKVGVRKTFGLDLTCNQLIDLSGFHYEECIDYLPTIQEGELDFFLAHKAELVAMDDVKREVEHIKEAAILSAIEQIDSVASGLEQSVCPVCGSHLDLPLLQILEGKREELSSRAEGLGVEYCKSVPTADALVAQTRLGILSRYAAAIGDGAPSLAWYAMAGGSRERLLELDAVKRESTRLNRELKKLQKRSEESYRLLAKRLPQLRSLFVDRFDAIDVSSDEKARAINVKFNRRVDTFSTGEINLMLMVAKVNEFCASDVSCLIVDDPLSSLDVANQYRMVFDLVNAAAGDRSRAVVVFTHSLNTLSIATSQFRDLFHYWAMESVDGELTLKPIDPIKDAGLNFRSLAQEARKDPEFNIYSAYLHAVIERDEAEHLHDVFHYLHPGYSVSYSGYDLSNDDLVSRFEGYDIGAFLSDSFAQSCIRKALLLVAARVWLEKELRARSEQEYGQIQLSDLVKCLFPRGKAPRCNCPEGVDREFLMSRKTLLNQASHGTALLSPFEYAFNISIRDLDLEIKQLRRAFSE